MLHVVGSCRLLFVCVWCVCVCFLCVYVWVFFFFFWGGGGCDYTLIIIFHHVSCPLSLQPLAMFDAERSQRILTEMRNLRCSLSDVINAISSLDCHHLHQDR